MSRVRHLDLFSGMGGFALAVQMLGHETIGFCDNDKASQELLGLRWPEAYKLKRQRLDAEKASAV